MTIAGDVFAKSTTQGLTDVALSFGGEKYLGPEPETYEWRFSDESCIYVNKFGHGYGYSPNPKFIKEQK